VKQERPQKATRFTKGSICSLKDEKNQTLDARYYLNQYHQKTVFTTQL